MEKIHLTRYSHGGGCGCKISPEYLNRILGLGLLSSGDYVRDALVGNEDRDDAAVYDLGRGVGLLCTTDFFMPIVDDPFDFGGIAAANALSDIYAMGGRPISAIAILGWPVKELPVEVARVVLQGANSVCREAGISIAGGHSIETPEPLFGLAVNGLIALDCLKRNNSANKGDLLFLTKPLGVGILGTAGKRGVLKDEDYRCAVEQMLALNKVGEHLGKLKAVTAMTDVTGFGLLGHLLELCVASDVAAELSFDQIPQLPNLVYYITRGCETGGGKRNWKSYGQMVQLQNDFQQTVLSDPQTNGGLLIAVNPAAASEFQALLESLEIGEAVSLIGRCEERAGARYISVI